METKIQKQTKTIIIYHKTCRDGWGSAMIAWTYHVKFGGRINNIISDGIHNIVFLSILPNEVPDTVKLMCSTESCDTRLRFFDLSFDHESLCLVMEKFNDVIILDHHKTTIENLAAPNIVIPNFSDAYYDKDSDGNMKKLTIIWSDRKKFIFDNEKCGARLTFDHYFPQKNVPDLINYIEDRDLWRWNSPERPDSKIVNEGLYATLQMSYSPWHDVNKNFITKNKKIRLWAYDDYLDKTNHVPDFKKWYEFLISNNWIPKMRETGQVIENIKTRCIKNIARRAYVKQLDTHKVYISNADMYLSDLGSYLYEQTNRFGKYVCDFVIMWRYDGNEDLCYVSLRSRQDTGADVSIIAQKWGGGGHKNAGGFTCTLDEMQKIIKPY